MNRPVIHPSPRLFDRAKHLWRVSIETVALDRRTRVIAQVALVLLVAASIVLQAIGMLPNVFQPETNAGFWFGLFIGSMQVLVLLVSTIGLGRVSNQYESWLKNRLRNAKEFFRNEDLAKLVGQCLGVILLDATEYDSAADPGVSSADGVKWIKRNARLAAKEWPKFIDAAKESREPWAKKFQEENLWAFVASPMRSAGNDRIWREFLSHINGGATWSGSLAHEVDHIITRIKRRFGKAIWEGAKNDYVLEGRASKALDLVCMRELLNRTKAIEDKTDEIRAAVTSLHLELRSSMDAIKRKTDELLHIGQQLFNQFVEVLDVLKDLVSRFEKLQQTATRTEGKVDDVRDATIQSLAQFLERPWEQTRQRNLPFHFTTQSDIPLHGHLANEVLPKQRDTFLSSEAAVLWWLWTGLEGAGKSRLAMDTCQVAEQSGWTVGFLSVSQVQQQRNKWDAIKIENDTLIVIDYVGRDAEAVRIAIESLCRKQTTGRQAGQDKQPRLRVLMLERHSEELCPTSGAEFMPQWVVELFQSPEASIGIPAFMDHQFPSPESLSLHVGSMTEEEARTFAEYCARGYEHVEDPASIASEAVGILWVQGKPDQGRPLHVQLTVFVLVQLKAKGIDNFEQALTTYLRHRVDGRRRQLKKLQEDNPAEVDKVINLFCVATVLREIGRTEIPDRSSMPSQETLQRSDVKELLSQLNGPRYVEAVQGIEPDMIGEWFVRLWCDSQEPLRGHLDDLELLEILYSIPTSGGRVADFVQRTYGYTRFGDGWKDLWSVLRSRLGRYSTPFGRLFDTAAKQTLLLGGTTKQAEESYHAAVTQAIDEAIAKDGRADVVDLMAGGSERIERLVKAYGSQVRILAIDRDVSRLQPLADAHQQSLRVVPRQITGDIDIQKLLKEEFNLTSCDIVIAKKALHELPWEDQQKLIKTIGEVVNPKDGRVVIYADSPTSITSRFERLQTLSQKGLPQDASDDSADMGWLRDVLARQEFGSGKGDAALFANLWIKLKDWANYNHHEFTNRYFSSQKELFHEFGNAGFDVDEDVAQIKRFNMELQPTRFIEQKINRLGYACSDTRISDEELAKIFEENQRYDVFWDFVEDCLLDEDGNISEFGKSENIQARHAEPFNLRAFLEGMDQYATTSRLRAIDSSGKRKIPSFLMPVVVFSLSKSKPSKKSNKKQSSSKKRE